MQRRTILVVDNAEDFLDTWAESLELAGFRVYKALSLAEAEQTLAAINVDLVVVDIRMRDEEDSKDVSGLVWAKQEAHWSVPKIILTRYPTYQHVRRALGPAVEGLPRAVNFLDKREGLEALVAAINRALGPAP